MARTIMVILFLLLGLSPAVADLVPGEDDPNYLAAVSLWLEDDEAAALPLLAELARSGNGAARVLIALIDKTPEFQGPWLSRLSRAERIALLRTPGGLSGRSWMRAVPKVPLAETWLELWTVNATAQTAMRFVDLGEERAARVALIFLAARQGRGFGQVADDPRYPPSLRFLIWQEWQRRGIMGPRIRSEISALHPGDPQRVLMGQDITDGALQDWLQTATVARPLASLCHSICPASAGSCARAGLAGLGGYRRLTMLFSDQVFIESARGQATLLRRVLLATGNRPAQFKELSGIDACFAEAVKREYSRF